MLIQFLDLPTYQPGDPSYLVTYAAAAALAMAVLGAALVASMRKGNESYKEKRD